MSESGTAFSNTFTRLDDVGVWQAARGGYKLPHPSVSLQLIKLVCKVLAHSFEVLRKQGKALEELSEDEITAELMEYIENTVLKANGNPAMGGIPGFTSLFFRSVTRQSNARNFNQSKIRPSPDLWFLLNYTERSFVLPSYDVLLVECKIVDATSHRPAGKWYCGDGMIRFVEGDYAWAMQEGIMLAYARNQKTIQDDLIPAMAEPDRVARLKTLMQPVPIPSKTLAAYCPEPLHASRHERSFEYLENKGQPPPIDIYHLWLNCC